jgi:hypothetical protein
MKQKNDPNISMTREVGDHSDQCSDTVQTLVPGKVPASALQRLLSFTRTLLSAHNQRVSKLGVYRRRRIDGASLGEREA